MPSLQSAPYLYDGNGNPTTYNNTAITFDQENRITSIGSVMTAGYRADNLRAWKQTAAGRTYYYYDGGVPVLETDASGTVTAQNVFAPDGLVARYQGSAWTYYTFDQQGNVSQRLDVSGTVLSTSTFDAYGAESSSGSPSDPFGYNAACGYMEDRETGLYYCQNRYFDPSTGRWINRDPIGFGGGINKYGYTGGAPIGSADPSGLTVKEAAEVTEEAEIGLDTTRAGSGARNALNLLKPFENAWKWVTNLSRAIAMRLGLVGMGTGIAKQVCDLAPRIVGANVDRVNAAAQEFGAQVFTPSPQALAAISQEIPDYSLLEQENQAWIEEGMEQGAKFIDIGPDFFRVFNGISSPSYTNEQGWLNGYPTVTVINWPASGGLGIPQGHQ